MKCSNTIKSVLVLVTTVASLVGCASFQGAENRQNLSKLEYGMKQGTVLNILGTPDSVSRITEDKTRWVYEFKKEATRGQNFYIDFIDGALTETGQLSGREIAAEKETSNPGICTKRVNPEVLQESLCLK